ncbi:MAG TPA: energy transducer TonB [Pyrinomonadaceae bacterium]|nr:energy transducer TonB [Pyrinomonadaceae bacterium]
MNYSSARSTHSYQPTIIESRLLIRRLALQIVCLNTELRRGLVHFKHDPVTFGTSSIHSLVCRVEKSLSIPNVTALVAVTFVVIMVLMVDGAASTPADSSRDADEPPAEIVFLEQSKPPDSTSESRIGKDGAGRVGFQKNKGEGSGPSPKLAQGGGGGGSHNPTPPQAGKLPPPSSILAAIPTSPPLNPPALPVAGIDIDPALWKDLKAPVYGDSRSKSDIPSKGPGEGEGIGTNNGLGIGDGSGPGVGPGNDGNIGTGRRQTGCCKSGGGSDSPDGVLTGWQVEQRARLLLKPEPKYTEEARRNQITGTVMLRVVFSSTGEVVQIQAVRTLPFGLTERAIAAAREIKFVPAIKGGRPVSVFMQLEYNFNLY